MKTLLFILIIIPLNLFSAEKPADSKFNEKRFIAMQIPGAYNLGDKGTWKLENDNKTFSISKGKVKATDLVWSKNPNVLIAKIGQDGVTIQMVGKGKAKWSYFNGKYKDTKPAKDDNVKEKASWTKTVTNNNYVPPKKPSGIGEKVTPKK